MPELSVVVVVGEERPRAQRVVDSVGEQTVPERIELVVVDHAPTARPIEPPPDVETVVLARADLRSFGGARLEGARAASAPIVAFLEDHVYAEPTWAERLLAAYTAAPDAVAIGYGFVNAHPDSYVATSTLLAEYGPYVLPLSGGETDALPGSNVSYRRSDLLEVVAEGSLAVDWVLQPALRRRGRLLVAPGAVVRHESLEAVGHVVHATYVYGRTLAAARVKGGEWGPARRAVYAAGALPAVPALRAVRLARSLRGRRALWAPVLRGVPLILVAWLAGAAGEAVGYAAPRDVSGDALLRWETGVPRRTR